MKNFLLILLLIANLGVNAQTVKVKKETARIKTDNADGFEVDLEGAADEVEFQLAKYLKPLGKNRKSEGVIIMSSSVIKGKSYSSPFYATVKNKGKINAAWIGVKANEWPGGVEDIKKDIERLVYEFGVSFYRNKIQKQIDESALALEAVGKQQQKLQSENKDFLVKVESNKRQKIQLEKSLENNKIELQTLTQKIAQNKKDQDSVARAGEQIKKVMELQKDKQRKVN